MLTIALTGGIASGKSAVASAFRELAVPVIDTDRIARDVVKPGERGHSALLAEFGEDILLPSGELDRAKLRHHIFSDAVKRQRLNRVLHPFIRARLRDELGTVDAPYVVVEIPLLIETSSAADFDRVLVVDVPEDLQLARLQDRDRTQPAEALAALQAQAPRQDRLALADDIIDNTGTLGELSNKVGDLHQDYLDLAKRFASHANRPSE